MSIATIDVKPPALAEVLCPHCLAKGRKRHIGAFVGRAQCKSCGAWVTIVLTTPIAATDNRITTP